MKQELSKILTNIFIALIFFMIAVFIYRSSNPYAYPGLENRILLMLVLTGFALLHLYFCERNIYKFLKYKLTLKNVTFSDDIHKIHKIFESNIFCSDRWTIVPPFIRHFISKWLNILYPFLDKLYGYILYLGPNNLVSYVFIGLFVVVAVPFVGNHSLFERVRTPLIIITVGVGIITFYLNKDKLDKVKDETRQEEIKEKRREVDFAGRYPGINRIWGVRWIARWMYKEGAGYGGGLILLLCIAFSIRVYHLTILYPYTDEYNHLIAAKSLLEIGTTDYKRAYFLTYIIYVLFEIFNPSLFIARLPGVFFGALTIVPIYLLVKKVSKPSAMISAWLWTISPWAIGVSRNVREYSIFSFFIIFYLIFLIYYVSRTINIINGEIRLTNREIPYILFLFLPLIYAFFIDPLSSFKQIMFIILPLGLYTVYLLNTLKSSNIRKFIHYINAVIVILGVILLFKLKNIGLMNFEPQFNEYWLNIFLNPNIGSPTQWYYGMQLSTIFVVFIMLIGILYAISISNKRNITGISIVLIFFISMYFYIFHFDRYLRPRYIFFLFPFFVFIISFGIFSIYKLIPQNKFGKLVFIGSILVLFNPFNAYLAITYDAHGYVPMTNEYHDNPTRFIEIFGNEIKRDDIVIASMPYMLQWYFDRPIRDPNLYAWHSNDEERFNVVSRIVSENNKGWIVLDWRRNGRWTEGLPRGDFKTNDKEVTFLGNYGGYYVYSWGNLT